MLIESFAQVIDDERINDIVISDDFSDEDIYIKVLRHLEDDKYWKVRVFRQHENLGMYRNKMAALKYAKNEWCLLWDSDNIFDKSYLDALDKIDIDLHSRKTIYCPDFSKPQFDYRSFSGKLFFKENITKLLNYPMGECLLNTCNYVVNKHYLPYEYNPEMKATDTIWMNYLFLKDGYQFYVVPGMEYIHRVHDQSGFLQDCAYNLAKGSEIKQLILNLK